MQHYERRAEHTPVPPLKEAFGRLLLARIATPSLRGCFRVAQVNNRRPAHWLRHFSLPHYVLRERSFYTQSTKTAVAWLGHYPRLPASWTC